MSITDLVVSASSPNIRSLGTPSSPGSRVTLGEVTPKVVGVQPIVSAQLLALVLLSLQNLPRHLFTPTLILGDALSREVGMVA